MQLFICCIRNLFNFFFFSFSLNFFNYYHSAHHDAHKILFSFSYLFNFFSPISSFCHGYCLLFCLNNFCHFLLRLGAPKLRIFLKNKEMSSISQSTKMLLTTFLLIYNSRKTQNNRAKILNAYFSYTIFFFFLFPSFLADIIGRKDWLVAFENSYASMRKFIFIYCICSRFSLLFILYLLFILCLQLNAFSKATMLFFF